MDPLCPKCTKPLARLEARRLAAVCDGEMELIASLAFCCEHCGAVLSVESDWRPYLRKLQDRAPALEMDRKEVLQQLTLLQSKVSHLYKQAQSGRNAVE